jgi:ubiquinone/menaquinone biosynthesis C-methylase UbiE
MNPLTKLIKNLSDQARKRRAELFIKHFYIDGDTKLLDLGSENGSNINNVLQGSNATNQNTYVSDINEKDLQEGKRRFGFNPIPINETGILPFEDQFFDIVFCSSVIEHVTLPKERIWDLSSSKRFQEASFERQKAFAEEINRLANSTLFRLHTDIFP